ncbi:hypothetical protein K3N28_10915 [Glycomyces sp. TRM65418]|uniref:hypothetical protein n=1 Tax=Glycomyces sp. TRM65418 TaxID=2867006 RepID=UPI001CE53455|nr:hypothetical protein [Glycomyces sp. TRM65418]MCC3763583.1 hypothetical protein [Glycomyces sp. TRM65418]QZD57566.1 hypothetical protein K3N28_10855 [Glycomyces sp. TRM65418]
MPPASDVSMGPRRWEPGSKRRMLVVGGIVLAFLGLLAAYPLFKQIGLDYRFVAPAAWSEACLGGTETVTGLLDWGEADAPRPDVSRLEPSYDSYLCDWRWRTDSATDGQSLSIEVSVNDDRSYGPFDPAAEQNLGGDGWRIDYETLNGWEHGICRDRITSSVPASYECVASTSNLRLVIQSRNLDSDSDLDPKYFGPGEVSVEDLTVEVGKLVREVFED